MSPTGGRTTLRSLDPHAGHSAATPRDFSVSTISRGSMTAA
jgi:hypothetical protein